jgi:hypothetical protein
VPHAGTSMLRPQHNKTAEQLSFQWSFTRLLVEDFVVQIIFRIFFHFSVLEHSVHLFSITQPNSTTS